MRIDPQFSVIARPSANLIINQILTLLSCNLSPEPTPTGNAAITDEITHSRKLQEMAWRFTRNAESERGSKLKGLEPLIRHFVTPSPHRRRRIIRQIFLTIIPLLCFFKTLGGDEGGGAYPRASAITAKPLAWLLQVSR